MMGNGVLPRIAIVTSNLCPRPYLKDMIRVETESMWEMKRLNTRKNMETFDRSLDFTRIPML